jgi:predicted phosphoribosyltransferase
MTMRTGEHEMFETIIAANADACRTEAEIADEAGKKVAIVFEDSAGWHLEVLDERIEKTSTSFNTVIEHAKEVLSHYVNRRGENPPKNATLGAFSLWLMVKDDGTAMGMNMKSGPKSC